MANEQQFCLRWNNHQSTLVSVFDTLLESGTLVDCTLAAEGQYLKAHKVVLSACSPYFELLLSQHYEKHPIIILKDVKFQELKAMMDYMYRGEVNISQDQLGALLKAAESLQIKGLSDSGGGGTEKEEPPEKYTDDKKPATPVRTPQTSHSSGLTIEQRRSAADTTEDDSQPLPRDASSREGSSSPVPRKRKKHRRRSSGGEDGGESNTLQDSHDQTSSSSERSQPVPNITQSLPPSVATIPSSISIKSSGETVDQKPLNAEVFPTRTSAPQPQPSIPREPEVLQKVEPPTEVLLEPKAEYLDEDVNEDSVEDLTLDDDDDLDMSMDHAQPGPSHGGEGSSQGYAPWHVGDQSRDEVFMAAQEAVGAHRDSQGVRDGNNSWLERNAFRFIVGMGGADAEQVFPCRSCGRTYRQSCSRWKHERYECGQARSFPCPYCNYKAKHRHHLVKHVERVHKNAPWTPPPGGI